jgi:RNA polymerase sigma-70 factor (ECF subfamily)
MNNQDTTRITIRRAQAGDRAALDALVRKYRPPVEHQVRSRVGLHLRRSVELDDIVQETFVRGFESIRRFREQGKGSFLRWLKGIAENVIREAASRQERDLTVPLKQEASSGEASPAIAQRRNERFDRLQGALNSLSPEHRRVIQLARIEKLPLKEVATRMQRTPEAVKQLLWRALQKLRTRFGDTDSLSLPPRSLQDGQVHYGG